MVGANAMAEAEQSVIVGYGSYSGSSGGVALGNGANVSLLNSPGSISIGQNSVCQQMSAVAIGPDSNAAHPFSVAIGSSAHTPASHSIVLGGPGVGQGLRVFETEVGHVFRVGAISTKPAGAFSVTVSELLNGIIVGTATGADTGVTLPTGTSIESGVEGLSINDAFAFKISNTDVTHNLKLSAVAGLTFVGANTIAAASSRHIWAVKMAYNTFSIIL